MVECGANYANSSQRERKQLAESEYLDLESESKLVKLKRNVNAHSLCCFLQSFSLLSSSLSSSLFHFIFFLTLTHSQDIKYLPSGVVGSLSLERCMPCMQPSQYVACACGGVSFCALASWSDRLPSLWPQIFPSSLHLSVRFHMVQK